jgi:predicted nucleic acid-binding protein
MHRTIISDTSCFIVLDNVGELDLLQKIYGNVLTTPIVRDEYGKVMPAWVEVREPADHHLQSVIELQLDKGEASAIALAVELSGSTIILDDYKARRVAEKLGLEITGTLGVIVRAKLKGLIPSVKPILEKIRQTDFRLSVELESIVLKEAGEAN